jgi:hypothetical protein
MARKVSLEVPTRVLKDLFFFFFFFYIPKIFNTTAELL